MKGLAALALALHASDAARTPGEVARFGFPYQSCKAGEFEDDHSSGRKLILDTDAGGGCGEGPFGNHLGVVFNTSLTGGDAYRPLQSSQTDFAAELTNGFTLELWVKPQALPQGDTADRVIVSLSAQSTAFTHEQMQALNCTQDEVSFQLIMKPSGCLVVHTKLISTDDCLASGAYERGKKADISPRQSAFKLPQDGSCATSDFSSDPSNPGLDLVAPKLQHVVVSLSAYMGGDSGPGEDRGGQADSKRFAVWVDSVLKTSDEHLNPDGEYRLYGELFNTLVSYGVPCGMKRTDGYRLATDKTKNFVPSAIWGTDHTLRVGFDGTANSPRFDGEVLLLAMYPRPLTASEVQANFEAKLDNSAPFAIDIASVVEEDGGVGGCSPLVYSFVSYASDWDTESNQEYPSLGTAPTQVLSFYVNTTLFNASQRGALYSDAACDTQLASAHKVGVTSTSLYFKPAAHEFSSGGPAWGRTPPPPGEQAGVYATLPWFVEDGNGGAHGATIRINVSAVNDAPVAQAGTNADDIYKGLGAAISVTGADMDGVQESNRLALCRVRIKSLPVKMADGQPSTVGGGKLYRLKRSATGALVQEEGATPLSVGDETTLGSCTAQDGSPLTAWTVPTLAECERDGLGLWYVSSSNYPAAEGQEVLGVDQFTFSLLDADGKESANDATYNITILSGLRAKLAAEGRACNPNAATQPDCGCDTCSLIVEEEAISVVELRGLNQGGGGLGGTDFVVRSLPAHGRLYQYNESATGHRGEQIVASEMLTDGGLECDGWLCKRVLYEGDLDYFNWPERTYNGTDLNVTTDTFEYEVKDVTTTSAPATVHMRVRNVNDAPVLNGTDVTFVEEKLMKIFGGITLHDPDRDLGYYRVTFKLDGILAKMTELQHKQSGTEAVSWDKWQGENEMNNVANELGGLLGYCPLAVCSKGPTSLNGCQEKCTSSDGSQAWKIEMFATPNTLRKVMADLQFFSKFGSDNELTITIEDFDDGEGAMDLVGGQGKLKAEIKIGIFAGEEGADGGSGVGDGGKSGSSDSSITSIVGVVTVLLLLCLCLCMVKRFMPRVAYRNHWGRRTPRHRRTRDVRLVVPLLSMACIVLTFVLTFVRCDGSPFTFYKMDVNGDGECSDEILRAHQSNSSTYEVNGECIAGIPQGFMPSRSLLLVLLVGYLFPLLTLEACGRTKGRILCAAVALAWMGLHVFLATQFTQYEQVPEPPWVFVNEQGEEVLGVQWADSDGALQQEIRPRQAAYAAGIFALLLVMPVGILLTVIIAAVLGRLSPPAEESDSSDDEERRRKNKRGKGKGGKHGSRREGKGGKERRKDKGKKSKDKKKPKNDESESESESEPEQETEKLSKSKAKAAKKEQEKKEKKEKKEQEKQEKEEKKKQEKQEKKDKAAAKKKPMAAVAPPPSSTKPAPPASKPKPPPPSTAPVPTLTYGGGGRNSDAIELAGVQVDATEWHFMDSRNQQQGPVSTAELREMFEDGTLYASTYVWCEDMDSWMELKQAPITL